MRGEDDALRRLGALFRLRFTFVRPEPAIESAPRTSEFSLEIRLCPLQCSNAQLKLHKASTDSNHTHSHITRGEEPDGRKRP